MYILKYNLKRLAAKALKRLKPNRPAQGFRILLYHSIDGCLEAECPGISLKKEEFEKQMKWLLDSGYRIRPLKELITQVPDIRNAQADIAITFDDGYKDNLTKAAPLLQKFNIPATFFVTLDYISGERKHGFSEEWSFLTFPDLNDLRNMGFSIGSHSVTHRKLKHLDLAELNFEIGYSKERLEAVLGCKIDLFSLPGGSVNKLANNILKNSGYLGVCTSRFGLNKWNCDKFSLRRIEIARFDSLREFALKAEGYYDWLGFKNG